MRTRSFWGGISAAAVLVFVAAPALAHGELHKAYPVPGAKVDKAPDHVLLGFTEPPAGDAQVQVTDGCGENVVAQFFPEKKELHVFLEPKGAPGDWKVSYRTISKVDGHPEKGSYSFSVAGKSKCEAGTEEPPEDERSGEIAPRAGGPIDPPAPEGTSPAPFLLMGVGAVALVGIALLLRKNAAS